MDAATVDQIVDMAAFVDWADKHDQGAGFVGAQLLHDLAGIKENDPTFSPRTFGFTKKV